MRESVFLLAIWSAFQLSKCRADCPFGDGPWQGKVNKCLKNLKITGDNLLQMSLFEGKTPSQIEYICETADIEKSINCAEKVLNKECKWKDVRPETRFLSFDGIKTGLTFICQNIKIQNRNQLCSRLQVDPYNNCTKIQTKISDAILREDGRYGDFEERLCSKYRIERHCIDVIYREPCGDEITEFKLQLNKYLMPPTCNCREQSFLKSHDKGECIDRSGCLFHIQQGMMEPDLHKGVLFGATNLDEVQQMCSHSEEEHIGKFDEAMDCVDRSNDNCNYNVMKYKQQKTTVLHLRDAAFYMCDRWQILVTKEEKEQCLFSKLHEYNDCESREKTKEEKKIKYYMKDDLKKYLCAHYRAKINCIYKTFSKCSMVLANVLEGVLMRKEPPLCRRCRSKGTFPVKASATSPSRELQLIVILVFLNLFSNFSNY